MKTSSLFPAALPLLFTLATSSAQTTPLTLPEVSPRATVSQTIGITDVAVVYHRPSVNKREVWGKLVPYGYGYFNFGTSHKAPWRAGANENTLITFQHDVSIAGKPLKAGKYGLFMAIAPEGNVTVIFSNDSENWGSFFYDQAHDALRVDVKWEDAPYHELLTYDFSEVTKTSAVLALSWEKKRIPIPISVETDKQMIASLTQELQTKTGFTHLAFVEAAQYLVTNNLDLDLALKWADAAIGPAFPGQRTFLTLSTKAQVLEKMGRAKDAEPVMNEALKFGNPLQIHQFGRQLLTAGNAKRAMEVFKLNAEMYPNQWPVNYGLARGYSALGDYKAALEALLKAQKEVPEGDTLNPPAIEANIEKLKRGENIN